MDQVRERRRGKEERERGGEERRGGGEERRRGREEGEEGQQDGDEEGRSQCSLKYFTQQPPRTVGSDHLLHSRAKLH